MKDQEIEISQSPPKTFIDYQRTRVNSVVALGRLRTIAEKVELDDAVIDLIDMALERDEKQKFAIAVVGEFKRGKSTFINALLGKEILPADIMPTSATLNRVTYGLQPRVQVIFKDEGQGERIENISVEDLANYVTKLTPEAEAMAMKVKEAVVYYPIPYCQNNVDIIDTPGLNDDATMTQVTLGVLPQVSAAILVIMATSPFSAYEADFLNNQLLLQDLGRVIFIVTAVDLIRKEADKERILKVITDRIRVSVERRLLEQFGSEDSEDYQRYRRQIGQPKVFGVSGYQALTAKEENDSALLAESKLPEFEVALEKFITETRGAVELQVLANRIIAASNEVLKKLNIQMGALQMEEAEFEQAYETSTAELDALRQRRDEEIRLIDKAAELTQTRVAPIIGQLPGELKAAAEEVVKAKDIKAGDLKKASFIEELGGQMASGVQVAAKRNSERIQVEIERNLMREIERLGNFAARVNQVLYEIEMQFVQAKSITQTGAVAKDTMAAIIGGFTGTMWGGVLAGYNEAGKTGAAVGGAAGLGTVMAGWLVIMSLSIPITWPVVLGIGLVSTFAGKFAARYAFRGQRIEKFRLDFLEGAYAQIDEHLQKQRPQVAVNEHINQTFGVLKAGLIGELDTSIAQTQSTLDKLRSQKTRKEAMLEHQQNEMEQFRKEVQDIMSKAQGLSSQLADITAI